VASLNITREEWATVSRLLDEAFELPAAQRGAWLTALGPQYAAVRPTVEKLLRAEALAETADFLEALPQYDEDDRHPAVAGTEDEEFLEGAQIGPYQLKREIGRGGMGAVWLAERTDGTLKRQVALKLLRPGFHDRQFAERFARERDILAGLTHPNIARLYDAGITADGQPFLALEYVEGATLTDYCDRRAVHLRQRLRLFLQVLDAVQYAHRHLVVHRDLKPGNILVNNDGQIRLLDFGIAKLLVAGQREGNESELTRLGGRAHTPDYASPEQVAGAPITTGSDIYSLGVVLYELLCGKRPYNLQRASPAALEDAILTADPVPPSRVVGANGKASHRGKTHRNLERQLRGDLDTIVLKALKKNPAERYATADALAQDLRHYLNGEPVDARPDSIVYRGAKFVRRNRTAVALSALVVVAMVAGLAGTITQAGRATRQAASAEEQRDRADQQAHTANEQRDFALRQLSRAEAINDLNGFLLSDAAPSGKPFTVGELLARAEDIVERQHSESDTNRAEMLVAIGRQYQVLDEDARARKVLGRAYEISRKQNEPSTRARAACALASALSHTPEWGRSENLVSEGLGELPEEPQFVLVRIFCLLRGSEVARNGGAEQEGVARAEAARQLLDHVRFPSQLLDMRVWLNVAESYRVAGRYGDSITAFEGAHARLNALGRATTETASTLFNNWGLSLDLMGQTRRAEELFRAAMRNSSTDPTENSVSPMLMTNLARVLNELDQSVEAKDYAERGYAKALRAGDEIIVYQSQLVRAAIYRKAGDFARAATMLREVEPRLRSMLPVGHAGFGGLASQKALLAQAQGDFPAAIELADQAIAIIESDKRASRLLHTYLTRRADLKIDMQRYAEARIDADRALDLVGKNVSQGNRSTDLGVAYLSLGRALHAQQGYQQAWEAFVSAAEHLRPSLGPDHRKTREAERLAAEVLVSISK